MGSRRSEEKARANLARLRANHQMMTFTCFDLSGCLAFLKRIRASANWVPAGLKGIQVGAHWALADLPEMRGVGDLA